MGVRLRRLFIGPFAILAAVALGGLVMPAGPASAASRAVASGATSPNYGPKPCRITITITHTRHGLKIVIKIKGSCRHDKIVIVVHSTPVTLGTITTTPVVTGPGPSPPVDASGRGRAPSSPPTPRATAPQRP